MKNRVFMLFISLIIIIISSIGLIFLAKDIKTNSNVFIKEQINSQETPEKSKEKYSKSQKNPNNKNSSTTIENIEDNNLLQINIKHIVLSFVYIISLVADIILLIYTKFYQKSLTEIFINSEKIVIFILITLAISLAINIIFFTFITSKSPNESTNSQSESIEEPPNNKGANIIEDKTIL